MQNENASKALFEEPFLESYRNFIISELFKQSTFLMFDFNSNVRFQCFYRLESDT